MAEDRARLAAALDAASARRQVEAAADTVGRRLERAIGTVEAVLGAPGPLTEGRERPPNPSRPFRPRLGRSDTHAPISVTIDGKSYRMACGEGEEAHLAALAADLGTRVADMRKAFGEIGDMRLQVMAALTIADEVVRARSAGSRWRGRGRTPASGGGRLRAKRRRPGRPASPTACRGCRADRADGARARRHRRDRPAPTCVDPADFH